MLQKVRKKLRSNKGESIAEVLASVLIVVMAMAMLAGAIITAAKVNKAADNGKQNFSNGADKTITKEVVIFKLKNEMDGDVTEKIDVNVMENEEGFVYYDKTSGS